MSSEIRTFILPDAGGDQAQAELAGFLRTIEVERIDTAYADGAWRVLVLYQDLKRKEETKQIESAIAAALNSWRDKTAVRTGSTREAVLHDDIMAEIAHFAPTTEIELNVILGSRAEIGKHGGEIVQVVRQTLESLIDP